MKILSIICHVPSSFFSYFLFVFVLFAPILVCVSIIIIITIIIPCVFGSYVNFVVSDGAWLSKQPAEIGTLIQTDM